MKLIYLTFVHCTCKFEKQKQCFLSSNYEQTFPNKKSINNLTHMKRINNFFLVKTIIELSIIKA
jgi:hypothetical protein